MELGRKKTVLRFGIIFLVFFATAFGIFIPKAGIAAGTSSSSAGGKSTVTMPDGSKRKVVLILVNATVLEDFSETDTPNIYSLMQKGGTALMNTKSAEARTAPNSYATIGAGQQVVSSGFAGDAFNVKATPENLSADISYIARTGMEPPAEGVVTLGISQIMLANQQADILEGPGALGEALKQGGLKTAVLGNGDVPEDFNRDAVTIAMDRWGRVDYGDVSQNLLKETPQSVLGYYTNYTQLLKEFNRLYKKADFTVVETGDTYRALVAGDNAFPEVIAKDRKLALQRADAFVGQVMKNVDLKNTLILLVSPFPSQAALADDNYMAPLVAYKPGQKAGFLTSGSTRREGIVTNLDIAPTVLEYLGVPVPPEMVGRAVETIPAGNVVETLAKMSSDMVFVYKARPVLVKSYVGLQILVMLAAIAIMVLWPKFMRYLRPMLMWLMAVPLSLLIIGAVRFVSLPVYALLAVLIAFLAVFSVYSI